MLSNLIVKLLVLLRIIWSALWDGIPGLLTLARDFCRSVAASCARAARSERDQRRAKGPCSPIDDPAYKRPDPLIYSQRYLMGQGLAVTWDNPDISLFRGGAPVTSSALDPDTEYEVVARVWNNSTEAPVLGLPVRFSYLSFGVGTQSHPVADAKVDLGVKGGPGHPAFAKVTWRTPAAPGHYCLQVLLDWLDDANPLNNLGQENTQVGEMHSPAQFTFTLRNATRETLRYRFEVDSYALPTRPPCARAEVPAGEGRERRLARARARHDRGAHPVPPGWSVTFDPPEPELDAAAEVEVRVTVTGPDGFVGRQPINVHAFNRYGLAGGVTLYVEGR